MHSDRAADGYLRSSIGWCTARGIFVLVISLQCGHYSAALLLEFMPLAANSGKEKVRPGAWITPRGPGVLE